MPLTPPLATAGSWLRRGALVLLIAGAGWFALRSGAQTPSPAARPATGVAATLVRVLRENVPDYQAGIGTVQAMATVTVKTRVDGQLERIGYVEGQDVKAGQVLAQLDARPLRAQLEQAQAQKARDEVQLANARVDLARYEGLIKEDATTQQTLDTQRALVAQLQAAVRTDTAQVHYAQIQLDYTTISAPLSGRTGARLVDPGNIVHAADPGGLVVINQIDPIAVVFTLPGDTVQAINRAQHRGGHLPVLVYGRDGGPLLARGELVLVNNQIDATSGTVQLKARFANAEHVLWPGQYVDVRLVLGEFAQALTVPAAVVQRGATGTYAYAVDAEGKAQIRPITVLRIQDGRAVVTRGLQAGETVVVDGQYKLRPGVPVVARAPAAAASAATAQADRLDPPKARP